MGERIKPAKVMKKSGTARGGEIKIWNVAARDRRRLFLRTMSTDIEECPTGAAGKGWPIEGVGVQSCPVL